MVRRGHQARAHRQPRRLHLASRLKHPFGFDALLLAGGTATRMGGVDKAGVMVGGRTLLDRALGAASEASRTIVVGPERARRPDVEWTREEPHGSGPVAAVAAGLERASAPLVVVLAADLPLMRPEDVERLILAVQDHEGAVFVDERECVQFAAGAYRTEILRRRLGELPRIENASLRELVGGLDLAEVPDLGAAFDCDTWDDVRTAERALIKGEEP